jgi:osmoprotectant transport system permease protein
VSRGFAHMLVLLTLGSAVSQAEQPDVVRVGAKAFTEQHILGELVSQLIERHTELRVERVFDLGGTGLCHSALVSGEIDVYVEYSGTALVDILKAESVPDSEAVFRTVARAYREQFDLIWLPPLGFNNTYVMAIRGAEADAKRWAKVSDLKDASQSLRAGFTSEFVERPDGYPGLSAAYGFRFGQIIELDPGLMYTALTNGQVDVICAFATDGRLAAHGLRVLKDERSFFPPYEAAPVVRADLLRRHPEVADALMPLIKTVDGNTMRNMNLAVDGERKRPSDVARTWIESRQPEARTVPQERRSSPPSSPGDYWSFLVSRRYELWRKILEHLWLTGVALLAAIAAGIPSGILIQRIRGLAPLILTLTEVAQTVPSLAMLAFLFALYGVLGAAPAISALVLYALLPIVLNTYTGLNGIAPGILEAADGIGMSSSQRLRIVELPLALPVIIAGVRTAAVWTVGIATLSTYIGAGGLGDFISRGLARNDPRLTVIRSVERRLQNRGNPPRERAATATTEGEPL